MRIFHLLVCSPFDYGSWMWAKLMIQAGDSIQVFLWVAVAQVVWPSPAPFQHTLAGSCVRCRVAGTEIGTPKCNVGIANNGYTWYHTSVPEGYFFFKSCLPKGVAGKVLKMNIYSIQAGYTSCHPTIFSQLQITKVT